MLHEIEHIEKQYLDLNMGLTLGEAQELALKEFKMKQDFQKEWKLKKNKIIANAKEQREKTRSLYKNKENLNMKGELKPKNQRKRVRKTK